MSNKITKSFAPLIWDADSSTGLIQLSNPPDNRMPIPDFISIEEIEEFLGNHKNIKGLIISGEGKHFSSGADLDTLNDLQKQGLLFEKLQSGQRLLNYIEQLDIPVVAAIEGVCFGGGLELALAAHFRFASFRSLFAFPEVNHGLMPGMAGTKRLTRLVGSFKTAEIIMQGDVVDAQTAMALGIINRIAAPKYVLIEARDWLKSITSGTPVEVIKAITKSFRNHYFIDEDSAIAQDAELFCHLAANAKSTNL